MQSMGSPNSIDSWDFATTINSPATSTLRHQALEELVAAEEMEEFGNDAVFEMEPEFVMARSLAKQQQLKHPRHEGDTPSVDQPGFDYDLDQEEEGKTEEVSSSTTGSELSRSTTDSTRNTSDPSTPSSSYPVSSSVPTKLDGTRPGTSHSTSYSPDANVHPQPLAHPKPEAKVAPPTPDLPSRGTSPAFGRVSSCPTHQLHPAHSDSDLRKRSKSSNLWKKLKSNLKTTEEKDSSPTERSKLGGLLASASRNTIGRSSKTSGQSFCVYNFSFSDLTWFFSSIGK